VLGLLALAAPVMAEPLLQVAEPVLGKAGAVQPTDPTTPTVVYSNVTNGPKSGYVAAVGSEVGDDLYTTGAGVLDSVKFSVFNGGSSAGPLTTADITLKFYNWDGSAYALAGSLTAPAVSLNLAPGYYTTLSYGSLSSISTINLGTDVRATITYSNVTGGATTIGQVLYDPPTIGASDDYFYKDGGVYWFGGNPVANMYWEVGVTPEPASMLLALAGLGLFARRRNRA
jgi:MYXO-CTERM domain-containing protein